MMIFCTLWHCLIVAVCLPGVMFEYAQNLLVNTCSFIVCFWHNVLSVMVLSCNSIPDVKHCSYKYILHVFYYFPSMKKSIVLLQVQNFHHPVTPAGAPTLQTSWSLWTWWKRWTCTSEATTTSMEDSVMWARTARRRIQRASLSLLVSLSNYHPSEWISSPSPAVKWQCLVTFIKLAGSYIVTMDRHNPAVLVSPITSSPSVTLDILSYRSESWAISRLARHELKQQRFGLIEA